jgi:outer membrane translocation and assembly module TamA
MLILNEEVRFPIYRWFRGVGFVDAGNVFESVGELSFTDLKVGVGLGLRLDTPFALFRLDYGVPVSREPDQPRARWFFSIGQMF